jgi:WD40 repeat protein
MIKNSQIKFSICLMTVCLILTSCRTTAPPQPTKAPTVTRVATKTHTITPSPTFTMTASPTITSTVAPTPTSTPTLRWEDQSLALTPLPPIHPAIAIDNVNQVRQIAVWGTGAANEILISPDGKLLVVGTDIGAHIYNSTTYQLLSILQTPHTVQTIAFSSDNQHIALGQNGGTIDIYDRDAYTLVARLYLSEWPLPGKSQFTVHFSMEDAHLISVIRTPADIYINRWETNTWTPLAAFSVENGKSAYINERINLVGIMTGETLSLQSMSFAEESTHLSIPAIESPSFWEDFATHEGDIRPSSDGRFILINNGSSIAHWTLFEDEISYLLDDYADTIPTPCYDAPDTCLNAAGGFSWECSENPSPSAISTLALTPDNFLLLVSLNEGRTEIRRVKDGLLVWEIDAHYSKVAFFPDGAHFIGLRPNGHFEKRNTRDGTLINTVDLHPTQLYDLDFSPDGQVLAAGFSDDWIRVYSIINGQMLGVLNGSAKSLQFSPNGQLLAAGLIDGTVRIFELEKGRFYDLSKGHHDAVVDLTFSADSQQLLTGSDDCTTSLWGLGPRYRIQNVTPDKENPRQITAVELSDINSTQYVAGNRNGIFVIEGHNTHEVLFPSETGFTDLAQSPDGQTLAVTGAHTWLLPDLNTTAPSEPQKLESTLASEGHCLAFTPSGSILIIATNHGLEFWSVEDLQHLLNLQFSTKTLGGGDRPAALTIAPDGSYIALGDHNGLINIYAIPENSQE